MSGHCIFSSLCSLRHTRSSLHTPVLSYRIVSLNRSSLLSDLDWIRLKAGDNSYWSVDNQGPWLSVQTTVKTDPQGIHIHKRLCIPCLSESDRVSAGLLTCHQSCACRPNSWLFAADMYNGI
ncbi:hypothetical protein NEOLEDRAFT_1128303 [Neolentinus lepideus HHB14362 ss-1]|uniref:Uncharacterized protein n=1 Tax=Neolentinus lepideus HHB14362 ss-1 TaxID=1314782 RepID=A0A165VDU5_9AGAM|nr:hypothetical protein NEOLEDRAFT_1128303 [Neolentinus lepideus HHB14362 ss-1]